MGGAGGGDCAVLPERRRSWPATDWSAPDAADVYRAAMLGLSDEGIEDALYDSQAIRRFVGIDLARETAPDDDDAAQVSSPARDEWTHRKVFEAINAHLAERGLILREGTIVDATFYRRAAFDQEQGQARDPEMHPAKKGNNWHFGMKAHIGVDAKSGLVHTVIGTAANVSDVSQTHALVHGEESDVFGDAGYFRASRSVRESGLHG